ncbi:MAG TPA: ergothioneine biosynthesis protein EgtB [Anditalea sp.]|nr:ergothioneine biosynthesis protein EgtB [Anditalea sp.]
MVNYQQYLQIREYTLKLCENLETEDYVIQAEEFVSPTKWHLAHTTWFFEAFVLKELQEDYREFNKNFNFFFNSYYNGKGDRTARNIRGLMTRPTVKEVLAYREYVDLAMKILFESHSIDKNISDLIELGFNHEQQHQELLISDLKYNLSLNPLFPAVLDWKEYPQGLPSKWVSVEEGLYSIGFEGDGFSYDNELGRHKTYLQNFDISSFLVTNGEFLAFMKDGGYEDHNLWHSEAWGWINEQKISKPLYWEENGGEYKYYTLNGLQSLDPNAPVAHVSFFEAAAYAAWKGCRLPTEFEWEAASSKFEWGSRWEWTNSAYLPYPNFTKAPGAIGEYNGKFMINQMVLRGASVATSPGHSRMTYRNFFDTYARWQFTGIRLAK